MSLSESYRVFFALWPEPSVAEALSVCVQETVAARRMQTESLHLTLAFVGAVNTEELDRLMQLGERLTKKMPSNGFDLCVNRLDYWEHNRIVWGGLSHVPPALPEWAACVREDVVEEGFARDPQPFMPHITLARKAEKVQPMLLPEPIDWPVREWCLAESLRTSKGAFYKVLAKWSKETK